MRVNPPLPGRVNPKSGNPTSTGKVMFVKNRFLCSAPNNQCSGGFYCRHVREFFDEGLDVGLHTVISSVTLDRTSELHLPLTNALAIKFEATVLPMPGSDSEQMLFVEEKLHVGRSFVSMYLDRTDSLVRVIRSARDYYLSTPMFRACYNQLVAKKRLPCENPSHNRRNDVDLVRDIKQAFLLYDFGPLELHDEGPVLAEIALENAHSIVTNQGKCRSCSLSEIDQDNIPDDLIPAL